MTYAPKTLFSLLKPLLGGSWDLICTVLSTLDINWVYK